MDTFVRDFKLQNAQSIQNPNLKNETSKTKPNTTYLSQKKTQNLCPYIRKFKTLARMSTLCKNYLQNSRKNYQNIHPLHPCPYQKNHPKRTRDQMLRATLHQSRPTNPPRKTLRHTPHAQSTPPKTPLQSPPRAQTSKRHTLPKNPPTRIRVLNIFQKNLPKTP